METDSSPQGENSKLPDTLAAVLPPQLQTALDHRVRRQVLRVLNSSQEPRSPAEVAATLPGASISVVSYHAQVLEVSGTVHVADTRPVEAGLARRYTSDVAGDPQVIAALHAMQPDDG
jgi:hypothetical protein